MFVSGIGCSSRFPYYMNTYGFHDPRPRSGRRDCVKVANPDLDVWIVTGDGTRSPSAATTSRTSCAATST